MYQGAFGHMEQKNSRRPALALQQLKRRRRNGSTDGTLIGKQFSSSSACSQHSSACVSGVRVITLGSYSSSVALKSQSMNLIVQSDITVGQALDSSFVQRMIGDDQIYASFKNIRGLFIV